MGPRPAHSRFPALMKIAVFGGTFNPIHFGHLRAAEEVLESEGLEKVIFMPAAIPPHKATLPETAPEARFEMLLLAIRENPCFEVSDIEIRRGGRSFTIDTVKELKEKYPKTQRQGSQGASPKDLSISLIVGSDSFNDITTWCEYETLLTLASFVVVARPGVPVKKVTEALPVELARKFWYDSSSGAYLNSFGTSVKYLSTTLMDISSSDIRRRVKEGLSIRYLMPREVREHILKKGLYR